MIDLFNILSLSVHSWTGGTAQRGRSEGGKLVVPISSHLTVLGVLGTGILLPCGHALKAPRWEQLGCLGMAPLLSVHAPLLWQNPLLQQGSVAI